MANWAAFAVEVGEFAAMVQARWEDKFRSDVAHSAERSTAIASAVGVITAQYVEARIKSGTVG